MRKWISYLIGALLIAGSIFGFSKYMKSYELNITMMTTIKPIQMIQAGQLITTNMIKTVSIPTVQHMENALTNPEDIIGKRAIVPIGEAEEILSWKIGEDNLYPGPKEQYIGFKVDFEHAVNNMVRRGDKVSALVEYTQPKVYDAYSGMELDETEQARRIAADPSADRSFKKVFSKVLLENLTVAYIKDQDGNEIIDAGNAAAVNLAINPFDRDENNRERYRQNATGQPAYITFIMSQAQYEDFATGAKEGTIRLGLPGQEMLGTIVSENSSTGPQNSSSPSPSPSPSQAPAASSSPSPTTDKIQTESNGG
ncbi:hypothetical protein ACLBWT_18660 [Paenibacillus sp. D51F]